MGVGYAAGEKRAEEAAKSAISSPLLDISVNGAKGVLFSIAGGDDLGMIEIQEAAKIITSSIDPNAKVIFGTTHDDRLKKGEIRVTVIATGFPDGIVNKAGGNSLFQLNKEEEIPVKEETKGKIFNSIQSTIDSQKRNAPAKKQDEEEKDQQATPSNVVDDDDDDWSVPSFLKRSRLK